MARIPDVLSVADLPYPELCAARLDGEIYRLDDSFLPIDTLDQPRFRARSLMIWSPRAIIAERRTAAWVYGALDSPPARHQFCVDATARVRPQRSARFGVREVILAAGDVVLMDGLPLTSPIRTMIDLAREPDALYAAVSPVIVRLSLEWKVTVDDCARLLDRKRNLPRKRDALALISAALE